MSGFSLNVVFSGGVLTSGGSVITSGSILETGSVILSGGGITLSGISRTAGGSIVLSGGSAITINTTLPEDSNSAYQQYLADKRVAMLSGGNVNLNNNSQIFARGYAGVSNSHLMSLNGVRGYSYLNAEGSGGCCLTIAPSVGVWAEHTENGPTTTLRALPPCITCDDYNKLFAAEMVLYHAINKESWNILNNGTGRDGSGLTGIWYRYQGLLAYWSLLTYSDAFLNYNCTVRENLAVNVGYANPSCSDVKFVCFSVVSCIESATASMQDSVIFYPGNMITSNTNRDNNSYNTGDPIPFIITYANNNGMSGAQIYCGSIDSANELKTSLTALASGVTVNGSSLNTIIEGGRVLSSIQELTSRPVIDGGWILGLAGSLGGQQYAAQPYTLGPAASTTSAYAADDTKLDTYSVDTVWWIAPVNSNFVAANEFRKTTSATVFKTYSLQPLV